MNDNFDRKMTGDSTLQKFSLQERTLHKLAQICWGDLVLLREINDWKNTNISRETTVKLVAHREMVVNNFSKILNCLPKTFATDLPKQLRVKLTNAIVCLQQGYSEALIWERKCQSALPFTILNPLKAGEYQAGYFIDPMGHFNDLALAKRFVADENQFVDCRFELACFYSFEEAIIETWHIMKTYLKLPCDGNLALINKEYGGSVGIWAYQLENKFDELVEEDSNFADGFYFSGLLEAIFRGHENAARFFWARCSDGERANFLRNPELELLSDAAKDNHAGLVNFIYSLLPLEQKELLITWTFCTDMPVVSIWSCLLHSPFYETVLKDILTSPFPIPVVVYECILCSLTYEMRKLRIPIYETIFEFLWNHLTREQRGEIFDENSDIMINLANIKALNLLKMIIQPLSHSDKERMLLTDWQEAGVCALLQFSKIGDYDALQRYLLFFLIDRNPITQIESLRGDATDFLDRFIKNEYFVCATSRIPESAKKEIINVIESLQESLQVLNQLLEKVEDMDCGKTKTLDII